MALGDRASRRRVRRSTPVVASRLSRFSLDFFETAIDEDGSLYIVHPQDLAWPTVETANSMSVEIVLERQVAGPRLR